MSLNKFIISLLTILIAFNITIAQNKNTIVAKAVYINNKVIIRYSPTDIETWKLAVKQGYKIERIKVSDLKQIDTSKFNKSQVIKEKILPLSKENELWKTLAKNNALSLVVYNNLFEIDEPDEKFFGLSLFATDLSKDVALAHGLYIADTTVSKNTNYVYKISIVNNPKKNVIVPISTQKVFEFEPINSLNGKAKNKGITLKWKTSDSSNIYTAYNIERSTDNKTFFKINPSPFANLKSQFEKKKTELYYTDSVADFDIDYFYRVIGITFFGENSPPSNTIKIKAKRILNNYPIIDSTKINKQNKVYLSWKMPTETNLKIIKGFVVERAPKNDSGYVSINLNEIPLTVNSFNDEDPLFSNYYRIGAISLDNDTAYSFPQLVQLEDNEPPAVPTNLTGKINENGIVDLAWDNNKENDLKGYRIFRANSLTEEFIEVRTKINISNQFTDTITLNTLTEDIYYKITAVDKVYNNSKYSESILLKKPDKIAPQSAQIKKLELTSNGIKIHLIKSYSADIEKYIIEHKVEGVSAYTIVKEFNKNNFDSILVDTLAQMGRYYRYKIISIDDSNNKSEIESKLIYYETGVRDLPKKFEYSVDLINHTINLNWFLHDPQVEKYIIYKAKNNNEFRSCAAIEHPKQTFHDKEIYPNNIYYYKIKVVYKNGVESKISDALQITF